MVGQAAGPACVRWIRVKSSRFAVRRATVLAVMLTAMIGWFVLSAPAFAFKEPNALPGRAAGCNECHFDYHLPQYGVGDCTDCHAEIDVGDEISTDPNNNFEFSRPAGPHSGYLTTTSKCRVCHSVHNAPAGGIVLLPAATIYGTCFTCHDGTGGWGVYGAIAARGGTVSDTSRHGILLGDGTWSSTNIVPGGDPGGGDLPGSFSGAGGVLMCNDCHSPHNADTVNAFYGDRARLRQPSPFYSSSKLLKRLPTGAGATTPVDDYGSAWCLTCHAGRSADGAVHNHPAETAVFTYSLVARLVSNSPTGLTELGPLGGLSYASGSHGGLPTGAENRGFLMPWPRTPEQAGHAPICQQCHEDSRSVGTLDATGAIGDAAPAVIAYGDSVTWNGTAWVTSTTDNPRFQNFPHETENPNMLVEVDDDLCLNCHPTSQLP